MTLPRWHAMVSEGDHTISYLVDGATIAEAALAAFAEHKTEGGDIRAVESVTVEVWRPER
jgi:hypothetical protein